MGSIMDFITEIEDVHDLSTNTQRGEVTTAFVYKMNLWSALNFVPSANHL